MRNLGLVLLAVSLVFGAVAVWGLKSLSGAHAEPAPAPQALGTTTIVVAARPIGLGERLGAADLKTARWPAGEIPPGAFHGVQELVSGSPRVALGPIGQNEPILPQRVSGPGGRPTLSALIRPGMRASTIRVDDSTGVAGFVLPGDFVDVLVTRPEGEQRVMRTDLLLQAVRVLGVDQLANSSKDDPVVAKAATIEVSPEQAQKLALGSQVGTLSLALRSQTDPVAEANARASTVRVGDLQTGAAAPARTHRVYRVAARTGPSVEVYRGAEASHVSVKSE